MLEVAPVSHRLGRGSVVTPSAKGGTMSSPVKRAGLSALGLVAVVAYWSLRGGGSSSETREGIPAMVWGGGGATLTIEAENTLS